MSARDPKDLEYIALLPELSDIGNVIIDDFHRIDEPTKRSISDLLKVTADAEDPGRKLVLIGINEAGKALIDSSPDLGNRVEVIRFEVEPEHKIEELVSSGERALDVSLEARSHIIGNASGSFYIAQLLCLNACLEADVSERLEHTQAVRTTYSAVQRRVVERQRERFGDNVKSFARGTKFRPGGRAPYLHILRWLSESDGWSINIREEMRKHPNEKASVNVVYDRGYLADLCSSEAISKLVHFDEDTGILSVEDPMLVYYLRSIHWADFVKEVGFTKIDYEQNFDVALSFAGEDREYAEHLRNALEDRGHTVFYDQAEQHQLIGQDVEAYLRPIYQSGSRFVVAILGPMYGRKRWTLLESSAYEDRFSRGEVLPIWSKEVHPAPTDPARDLGGLDYAPSEDLIDQATAHAEVISRRLAM